MAATTKKYIETVGRRKTATARVRVIPGGKGTLTINEKDAATYFPTKELTRIIFGAFTVVEDNKFDVTVLVSGGGSHSQAEAIRHGISRALIEHDEEANKAKLKTAGFLKRDARAKERRKFGLKKARKSPQWSKR